MRSISRISSKILFLALSLIAIIFSCNYSYEILSARNSYFNSITFDEFTEQLTNLYSDDEYESIILDKDVNLTELNSALSKNQISTFDLIEDDPLNYEEVETICEESGYTVYFDGENYFIDKLFGLKRLIVTGGDVENTYNATSCISGYKDYTILEYATIEETEYAYTELTKQEGLIVSADSIIRASASTEASATTHYTWGAGEDYINVDPYLEYIESNQTKTVVVAVLDTGIDTDHVMFTNRLLRDSNNRIVGARFLNDSSTSFEDDDGHGTHVSGIICDLTPDNVKILPVKVLNSNGEGYSSYMISALEYLTNLTDYDIVAVNMSISGETVTGLKEQFDSRFNNLKTSHNALSVVAAGNDSHNTSNNFPACCEDSAVVVSNMTSEFALSSTSNYGSTVDITAPGNLILSAKMGGGYVYMSGTSMAAPHVSAVVALLCLDPQYSDSNPYTADIIEDRLYELAIDIGTAGKDTSFGWGMVTLTNALGDISYSVSDTVVTYDGSYHNISVTINSSISSYSLAYRIDGVSNYYESISSSVFNNAFKNACTEMTVYFRITTSNVNYNTTYGFANLTINPRNIGISINDVSGTYGDDIKTLTWARTSGTYASGESASSLGMTLTTTATKTSDANSYPITGTWTNRNYNVTFTNGVYTINSKSVTVNLNDIEVVYGTAPNVNNCSASAIGLVNDDTIEDLNITYEISNEITANSSIGTYFDSISASINNSNYSATIVNADYIIIARPITIKIEKSGEYGDEPSTTVTTADYTVTSYYDVVYGDQLKITIELDKDLINSSTPVGSYTNFITASQCSNRNYDLTIDQTSTYQITEREIHIAVNNRQGIYGEAVIDDDNAYEITYGSVVNNDNLNINLTVNASENSVPGSYRIDCTYSNDNYNIIYSSGYFTISARPISITTTQTFLYGEDILLDNSNFALSENSLSILDGDTISINFNTTLSAPLDVGTYTDSITLTENNRYYDVTLENGTIIINPREITVKLDDKSSVYGNSIQSLTYTLYSGETEIELFDLVNFVNIYPTCDVGSNSHASTYTITATTSDSNNYEVNIINGTYTITARPITIAINNNESVYGEEIASNSYRLTSGRIISGDDLELSYSIDLPNKNEFGFYDVGEYEITAESKNEDYLVSVTPATYTIQKRKINITTSQAVEFGDEIVLDNNKFTISSGSYAGEDNDLNIVFSTSANSNSGIGNYTITMTYDNKNYDVVLDSGLLVITSQIIDIILYDQTSVYGEEITLRNVVQIDGKDVEISEYGIVLRTTATSNSGIGEYDITASCNNDNFYINYTPAKLTITKRPITIFSSQVGTYGSNPTLNNSSYELRLGSVVNNDLLQIVLSTDATNTSPVGGYSIGIASCNDNYEITISDDSSYTINPRQLTITTSQVATYGEDIELDNSIYYIQFGSVVNNDDLGLSFETDAEIYDPASNYSVYLTYYSNKNYDITFNTGTLLINPREITISTTHTGTYGDEPNMNNSNYSLIEGEIVNNDQLNLQFSTNATSESGVGEYVLILISNNSNYKVNITNSSYVISARPLTIYSSQSGVYGNVPSLNGGNYEIRLGEIVNNDSLSIVFGTNATSSSPVGEYNLSIISCNKNYEITIAEDSKYNITTRDITIKTSQIVEYGEEIELDDSYLVVSGTVVNNDDLGLSFGTNANVNDPVDNYEIYLIDYANKNYNITFSEGLLTISPRQIEIIINDATSDYGDPIVEPSFSLSTESSLASCDSISDLNINLFVDASINDSVGEYDIVLVEDYNKNYQILCETGKYFIQPRDIEIEIFNSSSFYGEVLNELTFDLADGYSLATSDEIADLNIILSTSAETSRNAGQYDINLKSYSNANYNISSNTGVYTISPRPLEIEIDVVSSMYGDELDELTFSLASGYSLAYEDTLADLNVNLTTSASATSDVIDLGYEIVMAGYNNSNYQIESSSGRYIIFPREILIEVDNKSGIYHDEHDLTDVGWEIVQGYNIIDGDELNISLNLDVNKNSGAGQYSIYPSWDNSNYSVLKVGGVYTIEPRPIEVTIYNQSGVYGDAILLDNSMFEFNGDELIAQSDLLVELVVNANETSDIGEYTIDGICNNSNYNATFITGTYTINKRKLVVKLSDQTLKRFFEFQIDQNAFEVVEGSVANEDDLDIQISSTAKMYSNIGNEFELTAVYGNDNYDIEFIDGVATISVSTTDIVAIVAVAVLAIYIIIRIVLKIKLKRKKEKGYLDTFNKWKDK